MAGHLLVTTGKPLLRYLVVCIEITLSEPNLGGLNRRTRQLKPYDGAADWQGAEFSFRDR
jgi:hypothetical protein